MTSPSVNCKVKSNPASLFDLEEPRNAEQAWILLDTARATFELARRDYHSTLTPLQKAEEAAQRAAAQMDQDQKWIHPTIHGASDGERINHNIATWQYCEAVRQAKQSEHDILGHAARLTSSSQLLEYAITQYLFKALPERSTLYSESAKEWLIWQGHNQSALRTGGTITGYPQTPGIHTDAVIYLPEFQCSGAAHQELSVLRKAIIEQSKMIGRLWAETPAAKRRQQWYSDLEAARERFGDAIKNYIQKAQDHRIKLRHGWRAWSRYLSLSRLTPRQPTGRVEPHTYYTALAQCLRNNSAEITFGKDCVRWLMTLQGSTREPTTEPCPVFSLQSSTSASSS